MKEWEKTEIEEGRPDGKISRRQFVKGMAWGAAAISLSSILRRCDRNGGNDKRSR